MAWLSSRLRRRVRTDVPRDPGGPASVDHVRSRTRDGVDVLVTVEVDRTFSGGARAAEAAVTETVRDHDVETLVDGLDALERARRGLAISEVEVQLTGRHYGRGQQGRQGDDELG